METGMEPPDDHICDLTGAEGDNADRLRAASLQMCPMRSGHSYSAPRLNGVHRHVRRVSPKDRTLPTALGCSSGSNRIDGMQALAESFLKGKRALHQTKSDELLAA